MSALTDAPAWSALLTVLSAVTLTYIATHLPSWFRQSWQKVRSFDGMRSLKRAHAVKDFASLPPLVPIVSKEPDFPTDWWTSSKQYELEVRAIFSKTWLLVSHASQFPVVGDYRTFEIAGFSFVLILGKDHKLRAFHNVCRHRAYSVCTKSQGNSTIMRCRYHGWTYDSTGKLVKAPKFEGIENFDKSQNGLFEVRNWIDSSGFIYVNFDVYGSDGLTIRVGVPISARLSLVKSWTVQANFNWKIAMPFGSFKVRSLAKQNSLLSYSISFESWRWPAEFELSPLTRLLRSTKGDIFLTISVVPRQAGACNIVCHLYCEKSRDNFEYPVALIQEDVAESVTKLQAVFDEVSQSGAIPDMSSQEPLLAEIKAHSRLERLVGTEVHPASRMRETSQACKVADDLCRELEAASGTDAIAEGNHSLAW